MLGEVEGIDVLLQQLAVYKRHDPSTAEEQELMENLFNVLCSCLLHAPNRELFLRGEGLQLMNLMLREKKLSRNGALRVLDHALTGTEGADCANKFVDILGLRTIFPLFVKTPSKHGKRGLNKQEVAVCRGRRARLSVLGNAHKQQLISYPFPAPIILCNFYCYLRKLEIKFPLC